MRAVVFLAALLLGACASDRLSLSPPSGVDFSGKWKLDEADSELDELNKTLGGRGGGKPDLAQAGGGDPGRLDETLALVAGLVEARV